jgi:hypothetical protein
MYGELPCGAQGMDHRTLHRVGTFSRFAMPTATPTTTLGGKNAHIEIEEEIK